MNVFGHVVILASALTACLAVITQISVEDVPFGGTVFLPCNSSAYGGGELDVKWQVMGKDVASFLDGQVVAGKEYEGRVELLQSETLEGDFSLTLTNAIMSDTDIYECLWQGKMIISIVTLNVLPPPFPDARTLILEGEDVTLPCFGKMPKNKHWENMYIQWLKDDIQVLLLESGMVTKDGGSQSQLLPSKEEVSQGNFSLTIKSTKVLDQGVYRCLYKTNDFEGPRRGHPEAYTLTVTVTSEPPLFQAVPSTTTQFTGLDVDAKMDSTTEQPALEVFQTFTPDDTAWMKKAFGVTKNTKSSTSMEVTGLITHNREDSTTVQDSVRVISDLPTQARMTTDLVGASANRTTKLNTIEVISDLPAQARMTTDLVGLISGGSTDSTTEQDPLEVISYLPPQARMTTDLVGLISGASADSTVEQDPLEVISDLPTQARINTDFVGLIVGGNADSTTEQNAMEVFQTFTPGDTAWTEKAFGVTEKTKSGTSMELTGIIIHDREDRTTVQNSVRVISDLPPQARMTTDLVELISGASSDSSTGQNPLEVFQTFTPDDTLRMEKAFGVTDNTKSSTSMEFTGLNTHDREDSTTVHDSVRVISDLPPQARITTDIVGLISGASADSAGSEQDPLEGYGYTSEVLWKENVPWLCIGIVSGVILFTAVFLCTLVTLGKL
ncbi:uncharacterized protein LOC113582620 isoform X1 [Electrophorus electricus]|uniref:uncharacterized protein LOC113582620 isoform X1 n=1 Tax=Electrophorus electricus TaxID=8005 RepID=UPI0015D027ED|nr:uncharacterized protein LOC113582620 isoform X1 [Electrophorus electricus]